MMFGIELIALAIAVAIAFSPLATVLLPGRYAVHILFHGCLLGMIYFAVRGMSGPACVLGIPLVIIGIGLLRTKRPRRTRDSLLD
jgi:hypothetical protein